MVLFWRWMLKGKCSYTLCDMASSARRTLPSSCQLKPHYFNSFRRWIQRFLDVAFWHSTTRGPDNQLKRFLFDSLKESTAGNAGQNFSVSSSTFLLLWTDLPSYISKDKQRMVGPLCGKPLKFIVQQFTTVFHTFHNIFSSGTMNKAASPGWLHASLVGNDERSLCWSTMFSMNQLFRLN